MRFFFYGTLVAGSGNPVAQAVHARLRSLGPALASGDLFAVSDAQGWFPALIEGAGTVHGHLYEAADGFTREALAQIDAYEDYDPHHCETSLYIRKTIAAIAADGESCEAQAYYFAQPLPAGSQVIADGDFRSWLAGSGLEEFRGLRSS